MFRIELDALPNYPTKPEVPVTIDENGNQVEGPRAYPIPDFSIVDDKSISILDQSFHQLDSKLSLKILHFLYGPEALMSRSSLGKDSPRLFLKNRFRNNWMRCNQYGHPITVFTSDIKGINVDVRDQLFFKQTHIIDLQHPYCRKLMDINKVMSAGWPWVTLEMSITEVRPGDLILGQIQLYEIDLDMKYYIEVEDTTPFTAYQLTN